jgi:NAD(P)-dependent dehydrogenase (short-subunit alcohol dehydrogenase family)
MKGKVCIVTGATGSLGKATAQALAQLGATVILACRNKERGEAVKSDIIAATGNSAIELMSVDLSSQQSIRKACDSFLEKRTRLDVLIHNAAVYKSQRTITVDGLETMFATNHIGTFLLTELLLDKLKASAPARILVVTAPSTTTLDFDNLQGEKQFNSLQAFGMTKMCNLLFTYELARRLDESDVTVNAVHPGLVKSSLMNEAPLIMRWISQLVSSAPDKSAATVAYLVSSSEIAKTTGKFLKDKKIIESNQYSHDPKVQSQLWNLSELLTKPK